MIDDAPDSAHPDRPQIDYPCTWEYTIIGPDPQRLRDAVAQVATRPDYSLAAAHRSRTGKYCSLRLTLTVTDEAERNVVFAALADHADIAMVL